MDRHRRMLLAPAPGPSHTGGGLRPFRGPAPEFSKLPLAPLAGAIRTGYRLGPARPGPSRFSAVPAPCQHARLTCGHPRFPGTASGDYPARRGSFMSRSRKALAAAAMAIAAGGGLIITAAGAVPAYAATQVSPPRGHPGSHVVATFTFQRAAPADGDGGGCDSGIVTCTVTANEPTNLYSLQGEEIDFTADAWCSEEVPQIRLGQDVTHSTPIDPNNPLTDSTVVNGKNHAHT